MKNFSSMEYLNGRIAIAATAHGIGDVKSVFGTTDGTTGIHTFSADTVQSVALKCWGCKNYIQEIKEELAQLDQY